MQVQHGSLLYKIVASGNLYLLHYSFRLKRAPKNFLFFTPNWSQGKMTSLMGFPTSITLSQNSQHSEREPGMKSRSDLNFKCISCRNFPTLLTSMLKLFKAGYSRTEQEGSKPTCKKFTFSTFENRLLCSSDCQKFS